MTPRDLVEYGVLAIGVATMGIGAVTQEVANVVAGAGLLGAPGIGALTKENDEEAGAADAAVDRACTCGDRNCRHCGRGGDPVGGGEHE